MTESNAWLQAETARRYKLFTQKTTMYQELSRFMIDLADIQPGMSILDLGCGTGVTTQAALAVLQESGHIYALDISEAMLEVARENISSDRVTFHQADAADAASLIDQPIHRIICNSVFWQIRDKPKVMAGLRQVLAPDGLFVFNVPEPYFIFKSIPRSNRVGILFKQLAAEKYGVGPQDLRTINVFLENQGFEVVARESFERIRSAEESYLFSQIPVTTDWMEPPLDYQSRMALLEEAKKLADPNTRAKRRWMYFVARLK